jgi:hypothetical protein
VAQYTAFSSRHMFYYRFTIQYACRLSRRNGTSPQTRLRSKMHNSFATSTFCCDCALNASTCRQAGSVFRIRRAVP